MQMLLAVKTCRLRLVSRINRKSMVGFTSKQMEELCQMIKCANSKDLSRLHMQVHAIHKARNLTYVKLTQNST